MVVAERGVGREEASWSRGGAGRGGGKGGPIRVNGGRLVDGDDGEGGVWAKEHDAERRSGMVVTSRGMGFSST
jgi:hypothetical protein